MPVMTLPAFPITVSFTWTEPNVIPPRCRNPRNVEHPGQEHIAYVPTATPDEAPVALRSTPGESQLEQATEWRYFEGHLYEPYKPYSRQTEMTVAGSDLFPSEKHYEDGYGYRTPDLATPTLNAAKQNIDSHFICYLIVDGEVWVRTAEPCYRVETYNFDRKAYLALSTPALAQNHGAWKYFNANERQEAIEAGLALMPEYTREANRKDLEDGPLIEVLIPEAVQFQPDRISAKGREQISRYEYRDSRRTSEAFKAAADKMDAASVGRGETGYADYLEHAAAALIAEAARIRTEGDDDF